MANLISFDDLSWLGTSCLSPRRAERELFAMRTKPFLKKDVSKLLSSARGSRRRRPSRGLTSDQVILAFRDETAVLQQALVDPSDYRLAQCSMNRLDSLEGALWEAHNNETHLAADLEAQELKRCHNMKREALESNFKLRGDRLREGCDQRADSLRLEHEGRLADVLEQRAPPASGDGERKTLHDAACRRELLPPSTVYSLASPPVPNRAADRGQDQRHQQQQHQPQRTDVRSPAASTTTIAVDRARSRGLVELRAKLAKHLAMAHEDGQHLEQATGVMREIEELEAKARLETEEKARSGLGNLEACLQQAYAQAVGVQKDKHGRLLRALERSRVEDLRILLAHHKGALGRLAERRRDENRRRKKELRERLAAAKGCVARVWKKHNNNHSGMIGAGGGGAGEGENHRADGLVTPKATASPPTCTTPVGLSERRGARYGGSPRRDREGDSRADAVAAIADAGQREEGSTGEEVGVLVLPSSGQEIIGNVMATTNTNTNNNNNNNKDVVTVVHEIKSCGDGQEVRGVSVVTDVTGLQIEGGVFFSEGPRGGATTDTKEPGDDDSLSGEASGRRCESQSAGFSEEAPITVPGEPYAHNDDAAALRLDGPGCTEAGGGREKNLNRAAAVAISPTSGACPIATDDNDTPGGGNSFPSRRVATAGKKFRRRKITAPAASRAVAVAANAAAAAAAGVRGDTEMGAAVDVLSEEEAQSLAALGRGTPDDPRLLLLSSPAPPSPPLMSGCVTTRRRGRNVSLGGQNTEGENYNRGDGDGCGGRRGVGLQLEEGRGGGGEGGGGGGDEVDVSDSRVVQRAVDKLVSELRVEAELTRRRCGMEPYVPSSWW